MEAPFMPFPTAFSLNFQLRVSRCVFIYDAFSVNQPVLLRLSGLSLTSRWHLNHRKGYFAVYKYISTRPSTLSTWHFSQECNYVEK